MNPSPDSRLLRGFTVLEAATFVAGPTAGGILADMGADVIKIDSPVPRANRYSSSSSDSSVRATAYDDLNRGKRSIVLNLHSSAGQAILHQLTAKADVFLTNFSLEHAARFAVDYTTLKRHNPRLVYARLSGWGSKGPRANSRAFDYLIQGPSGLMWNTGNTEDPRPSRILGGVVDTSSGTFLAMGILAALLARERQGITQELEVSLLGSALHLLRHPGLDGVLRGKPSKRNARLASHAMLCYYQCRDGKWLNLCDVQFEQFWPELAAALALEPSLAARLGPRSQELVAVLDQVFLTRTRDEWLDHFAQLGCHFGYAPVYTLEEAALDAQVLANRYVIEAEHPRFGWVRTVGFPVQFADTPSAIQRPPPDPGQDTDEVLSTLCGFAPAKLAELRASGVVA